MAFSYAFHLSAALVGLFVFIYTYACVCVFIYQNKLLKMRVTKVISYAMKFFLCNAEGILKRRPSPAFYHRITEVQEMLHLN